jgi:hypothetical protein
VVIPCGREGRGRRGGVRIRRDKKGKKKDSIGKATKRGNCPAPCFYGETLKNKGGRGIKKE